MVTLTANSTSQPRPSQTAVGNGSHTSSPLPPRIGLRHEWRWFQVLMQVRREAEVRGHTSDTISVTISTLLNFLRTNGQEFNAPADRKFLAKLDRSLKQGGLRLDQTIVITSSSDDLTALETRTRALVRAYRGLTQTSFSTVLRICLQNAGLKYSVVAGRLGVSLSKLKTWLANNSDFIMDMTPAQAVRLDGILGANGKLISTYAAMTQEIAFAPVTTAIDLVLGRETFSTKLRRGRQGFGFTKRTLLDAVGALSGINVDESVLSKWEQGQNLPRLEARGAIALLDDIYEAQGALLEAWEAEGPTKTYAPYVLRFAEWPETVRAQFQRVGRYKRDNPEKLERSQCPSGDRWQGDAAEDKLRGWCEHFFGFVVNVRNQAKEQLSLTQLADWDLVYGYLEFVRTRTGRMGYTQDAFSALSQLHNLYLFFLPALHADAAVEPHWSGRLPLIATKREEVISGVFEEIKIDLQTLEESWCYHLALAAGTVREFQRNNQFDNGSLLGRAEPLLDAEVGVARIAAEVSQFLKKMPVRIRCRQMAILSRCLAVVALSIARNFRPATFRSLRLNEIKAPLELKISLNIGETDIKTKGKGISRGGVQGPLPDWEWIHYAIWYYLTQGRPFLVRDGLAHGLADAGYFFTPAAKGAGSRPGRPLSAKVLQADSMRILGYKLYAQRYIFAHDAWGLNIPIEDTAINLQHGCWMTLNVYSLLTALQKNRRANRTMEAMLVGDP